MAERGPIPQCFIMKALLTAMLVSSQKTACISEPAETSPGPPDTRDKHTCPATLIISFPSEITTKRIQKAFQKHWAIFLLVFYFSFFEMSKAEISGMAALSNWDFKWFWLRKTGLPELICSSERGTKKAWRTVVLEFCLIRNLHGKTSGSPSPLVSHWNLAFPLSMNVGKKPCYYWQFLWHCQQKKSTPYHISVQILCLSLLHQNYITQCTTLSSYVTSNKSTQISNYKFWKLI